MSDRAPAAHSAAAERPTVSVIVPTRNRSELLQVALASAVRQQGLAVEVLVVDDGSTDGTYEAVIALDLPNVRVLRQPESGGVARARNLGIAHARGEWLAFLDDDDLWAPTKLRQQVELGTAREGTLVYCASIAFDNAGNVLRHDPAPDADAVPAAILGFNVIPGGCSGAIARAAAVRAVGGFDERLSILADWDLWIRLIDAGRAVACNDTLVAYREHGANMSLGHAHSWEAELGYIAQKHAALGRRRGVPVALGASRDRSLVHVQRRTGNRSAAARTYLRLAVSERSPAHLTRAAVVLLGERAMRSVSRVGAAVGGKANTGALVPPPWLETYRASSAARPVGAPTPSG